MEKVRRKQRDELDYAKPAAPSGAGSTGDGASGHLNPYDLSRFEGEGGPGVPEPAAPEPQEKIDAAQSRAATKSEAMNERT
jgi:hypothetical protein